MARLPKSSEDLAVLIEFDNAIVAAIAHPDVLIGRNDKTVRIPNASPLLKEITVGIEDLDALVFPIAHINAAFFVDCHRMRKVELARARSVPPPSLDVIAGPVELHHTRIAVAVGNIDFATLSERHVGRFVEQPVGLSSGINAPKDEQNIPRGRQLEHEMVAVVCRPQIVVRVDA